jgi:hypothetical protein
MTATIVTATGDAVAAGRMKGATPTQAEPVFFNWGYNPATLVAGKTDVALFQEGTETRVTGTSSLVTTTYTGDTWQLVATQTAAGTEAVGEFGCFDSATKAPSTTVSSGTAIGSSSATGLTVAADSGFPGSGTYYAQVRTEVVEITAGAGTTSWTLARAQNGSTAITTITAGDEITAGNVPGSTTISGGTMFVHGSMSVLNLNAGDSLTETVKVSFA